MMPGIIRDSNLLTPKNPRAIRFAMIATLVLLGSVFATTTRGAETSIVYSPEEILRLAAELSGAEPDPQIRDRVSQDFIDKIPGAKDVILLTVGNLLAVPWDSSAARAFWLERLAIWGGPDAKPLLMMEIAQPTSYPTALTAAEDIRYMPLTEEEIRTIEDRAAAIDADIARIDPPVITVPPRPGDPVAPPPPRQRLYANELGRLDLYHALCGAISSDPLCSTLSSGLRATAESRFADPALRPQIVAFTSSMDAPDIRNQAKEAQKFVKKIAKRLEKEKPLKDKVLKEIDKNLAPTDPLTIAFRALVESLTEEQLAELLRSILPSDEEQTAAMLDRARGAMMAILDAEAAEEARRRTGQLDAEWARAWIENHQRQSVGGVLRASALFLRAKNPPQPD